MKSSLTRLSIAYFAKTHSVQRFVTELSDLGYRADLSTFEEWSNTECKPALLFIDSQTDAQKETRTAINNTHCSTALVITCGSVDYLPSEFTSNTRNLLYWPCKSIELSRFLEKISYKKRPHLTTENKTLHTDFLNLNENELFGHEPGAYTDARCSPNNASTRLWSR